MNVFTWSSDDNALVANFAFPAPLRDESLSGPSTSRLRFEFFFFNARGPTCNIFIEYEVVWNRMKLYEIVWNRLWKNKVGPVGWPPWRTLLGRSAKKASVADTCHRRGWTTCWISLDLMSEPGTFTLRAFVCVNCQTKNPANCRMFSGPEARRCVVGHIYGTKLYRGSLKGYTRIPITFNERDRSGGGCGAAGPLPAPRGYGSHCEVELESSVQGYPHHNETHLHITN